MVASTLYDTCKTRCYPFPFSSRMRNFLKSNFVWRKGGGEREREKSWLTARYRKMRSRTQLLALPKEREVSYYPSLSDVLGIQEPLTWIYLPSRESDVSKYGPVFTELATSRLRVGLYGKSIDWFFVRKHEKRPRLCMNDVYAYVDCTL